MHKHLALGLLALTVVACDTGETTEEPTAQSEQAVEAHEEGGTHATPTPAPTAAGTGVIERDHYRITTDISGMGLDKRLIAVIEPTHDFHVNHDYPWALNFIAGSPITGGPTYRQADAVEFTDTRVRFEITPTNEATGELTGNLRFGVCSGDVCENPREDITWSLD